MGESKHDGAELLLSRKLENLSLNAKPHHLAEMERNSTATCHSASGKSVSIIIGLHELADTRRFFVSGCCWFCARAEFRISQRLIGAARCCSKMSKLTLCVCNRE